MRNIIISNIIYKSKKTTKLSTIIYSLEHMFKRIDKLT